MESKKSRYFKVAHAIAKKTVSIVGDYHIAFSIALKDLYNGLIKYATVKAAFDEQSFDRSLDMRWALLKVKSGAYMIMLSGYPKDCSDFKPANMVTLKTFAATKENISALTTKFDSSAKKFIFSHALQLIK